MVGVPTHTRMGCTGSVVYPDDNNEKLKQANGVKISIKNGNANHLRGDYSQLQLAKHNRDKYVKQRQGRTFAAANEMSGRIMEEREMLSLGTRSRGTSRDTSRAASPTIAKKNLHVKDEIPGQMTPVAEDLHSRDSRRVDHINHDVDEDELLRVHKKSKTHKHKSSNKAKKKHKAPHNTSKPKDKSKKHKKSGKKTTKLGKDGVETLGEAENVDSGLEDNQGDSSDEDNDETVSSEKAGIEKGHRVKWQSGKGHREKEHNEKARSERDAKITNANVVGKGDNEVTSATDVKITASGVENNGKVDVTTGK